MDKKKEWAQKEKEEEWEDETEENSKGTPVSQDLIKQALIEALNTLKPAQAGGLWPLNSLTQ